MRPDIEKNLRVYMPLLFELLGSDNNLTSKQWQTINDNFEKDFQQKRQRFLDNNNYLRVAASLYEVISSVLTGDESAEVMLNFINTILLRLVKNLSDEHKSRIRKTVYGLLVSFDERYRNYLGELAVLNNLLESQYSIIAIDKDIIAGNTTADFTVEHNGERTLVEVVSIHLYESKSDVAKFISGKITKKINEKTNGGTNYKPFQLVPILWAFPGELKRIQQLYNGGKIILPQNTLEPFAYCSFFDDNIGLIHRFHGISSLFTNESIEIIR